MTSSPSSCAQPANFKILLDAPESITLPLTPEAIEALFLAGWQATPTDRRPTLKTPSDPLTANLYVLNDADISELNQAHMQHDGPTDVLSFPMGDWDLEREAFMLGEIIISYETAEREALARGLSYQNEFARYALHGLLHLIGYEDKEPIHAKEMHALQESILKNELPK